MSMSLQHSAIRRSLSERRQRASCTFLHYRLVLLVLPGPWARAAVEVGVGRHVIHYIQ